MQATKEKGYTLIELIAVISLLMLLSIPVISYANIENLKADFAVRRYVSDIRYVYNKNTFGDIDCYLKYIYTMLMIRIFTANINLDFWMHLSDRCEQVCMSDLFLKTCCLVK